MFCRISREVTVQVDTGSSKVERFIVEGKAFVLQEDALVYDSIEIAITDRPLYEIFEQVTKIAIG